MMWRILMSWNGAIRKEAITLLCLHMCLSFAPVANADVSHPKTNQQVRKNVSDAFKRISAWYVEYRNVHNNMKLITASKAPSSHYIWSFKSIPGRSFEDDPLQQRSVVTTTEHSLEFPFARQYYRESYPDNDALPGSLKNDLIFQVLGWWSLNTRPSPKVDGTIPAAVLDVLADDAYVTDSKIHCVQGRSCIVISKKNESALWFDANRAGVLMVREFYDKDTGVLQRRLEMSKHKEVKPGIWCPMEFRNIHFDCGASTSDGRKRRTLDATFRIDCVKLNEDVPAELFAIPEALPGTIQISRSGIFRQCVPGGYDYMDKMADWIQRNTQHNTFVTPVSVTEIVSSTVAILLLWYMIFWCWRSRRAGKSVALGQK